MKMSGTGQLHQTSLKGYRQYFETLTNVDSPFILVDTKMTTKKKQGQRGFVPVKARWVIERTNSWMERCKSLVKKIDGNS